MSFGTDYSFPEISYVVQLCVSQAAWSLKTRALTEMVYIDEVEVDQEGIAEMMLDESSIAQVARKFQPFVVPSG